MAVIATVTTRPRACLVATVPPARSICDSNQPPKISPCGLASAGIAMARSAGSDCGGASVASLALIVTSLLLAHDLFRKPELAFRGHAVMTAADICAPARSPIGASDKA